MNSNSKISLFFKDCWNNDKKRIKYLFYKSVQYYENFEYFRLRSKVML